MTVQSVSMYDFRNIEALSFKAEPGVNVIYGANAQGKTNLLEGIWLFTGCKSFRNSKDSEFIRFNSQAARLSLNYCDSVREKKSEIAIGEKKIASLNGVKLSGTGELIGSFYAVVFSPAHLSLVQAGPSGRRKFADVALCQLKPRYAEYLSGFHRALLQRNAILKDINYNPGLYELLESWEEQFCDFAAKVIFERQRYIELLSAFSSEIYSGISENKEKLSLFYDSTVLADENMSVGDIKIKLSLALKEKRSEDMQLKVTSAGPHRDDIGIKINNISARSFGSQGQQRSAALSLKLGEAEIIRQKTGETPVALLDDVMSELDEKRQDYILNHINDKQVFLTCCDPSQVLRLTGGKAYRMENGILTEG